MKRVQLTEDGLEEVEKLLIEKGLLATGNLYDVENTQVVHHLDQALVAVFARKRDTGLYRQGRQGRDHRRIHRPHDGRAALVERAASGGRGQGKAVKIEPGKPDHGFDHFPELFPDVSQTGRHDRHGRHRSGRVLGHLQGRRGRNPHQPAGRPH